MTATILIVEDHPLYRGALVTLMHGIVGPSATLAAHSAEEGLRLIERLDGQIVILLDLGLPGLTGLDCIAGFQRKCPAAVIIVVSASEDRQETTAALRAGARAVLSKAVTPEVMTDLIRRVLSGALTEPEWITPDGRVSVDSSPGIQLTPRQSQVLAQVMTGHSNKEIALRLGLSQVTVAMHLSAVFRALNVVSRTQAVAAARRLSLSALAP